MNQGDGTTRNVRRQRYLDVMGILRWQLREMPLPANTPVISMQAHSGSSDASVSVSDVDTAGDEYPDIATLDWDALRSRVSECTACELHTSRTQTVFGTGDHNADWLVIGEAPGADEDAQGEPFVGRAGQLLNAMLLACGFRREQVYIANILKCRPPNNRDPRPEEVTRCEPYLMRQIELIQPKLILAVGRIAAQNLLQCDTPIGKLRGSVHHFRDTGIPLVATYHPAYLLRSPGEKRKAWQDLQLAMRTVQEGSS